MSKRKLKSILSNEIVHDWDEFKDFPLEYFDKEIKDISWGQGGYLTESWEWHLDTFEKDEDGHVVYHTWILPPTISRMINWHGKSERESQKRKMQDTLRELIGV